MRQRGNVPLRPRRLPLVRCRTSGPWCRRAGM